MLQVSRDIAQDMPTPLSPVRLRLERLRTDVQGRSPSALRPSKNDLVEALRTFDALLQLADIEAAPTGSRLRRDSTVVSRLDNWTAAKGGGGR